jgi:hypothetical protein
VGLQIKESRAKTSNFGGKWSNQDRIGRAFLKIQKLENTNKMLCDHL